VVTPAPRARRAGGTEQGHPHGWLGYVVADPDRTANALRLARGLTPVAIVVLLVLAATLVAIALVSPATAAGLLGGGTAAGGLARARRRRRLTRRSTTAPTR
jgi:hypothetical protein